MTQTVKVKDLNHTLIAQWNSLSETENDFLVNSSQFCAFIMQQIDDISWAGFYWNRQQQLVVGAYQGPVACTHIGLSKGVCGAAFTSGKTQVVVDVHQFPGHIACDSGSASELVIPIFVGNRVIGVFDIDSYTLNRFDHELVKTVEELVRNYTNHTTITYVD